MIRKKIRLYYWLVLAFIEKYLLYVSLSFFLTSVAIALYIFFSKDILQVLITDVHTVGIRGVYTLDNLPPSIMHEVTIPLFSQKPDGTYESKIVKSYSHDKTFSKFEIVIFPDLTFTDKTPFTSDDIQFVFKDVKITRPDKLKILYELNKPFPPFLSYLDKPVYGTNPFRGIKGDYFITQARYASNNDRLDMLVLSPLVEGKPKLVYKFYRTAHLR
jgi:ABC-type transport system substrate-binding protein